jgi:uncharacterized membrane protein YeaQ/YmgE (transglycosylase-associated protein family)
MYMALLSLLTLGVLNGIALNFIHKKRKQLPILDAAMIGILGSIAGGVFALLIFTFILPQGITMVILFFLICAQLFLFTLRRQVANHS